MADFINISYRSVTKIAHEGILRAVRDSAKHYAKGKLVDLGCGVKPYESIFTPYIDSYFGVDFKPTSESNYGKNTQADLYVDCTNTGLGSESFDTLLSTQVMEHILETDQYLSECYRLLRKNGHGIFTVPFLWQLHSEPYDYFRFTPFSLKKLFEKNGFKIIQIVPLEGAYAALKQAEIVSLYVHSSDNHILIRLLRKIQLRLWVPVINFFAIHLDRMMYNDKLCINYSIIVKKL